MLSLRHKLSLKMAQGNLPRRVIKETHRLISDPPAGISAIPLEGNLRYFNVSILGLEFTCYEGGVFHLEMFLPEDYPTAAPKVRFLTKIYHPDVDKLGRIYLDILSRWSPALRIDTILLGIQQLLCTPKARYECVDNVGRAWREDEARAMRTAKEWTQQFASC